MGTSKDVSDKDEEVKRLKEEIKKKDEKIRRYKQELANSSVIERWKLGEYLHDNLAQQLTSVEISLNLLKSELSEQSQIEACNEILNIISDSVDEVRDLSHEIIPMDVEEEGVEQAFNHLKKQSERRHRIICNLETTDILQKIKRRDVATNLYNIAQEAIKNAVMHGEASNIKIALIEHNEHLYLHVKDDGKGFDSSNEKSESGMGITIMRHRAEEMGGNLRIKEAKDDNKYNTCVTCTVPLETLAEKD